MGSAQRMLAGSLLAVNAFSREPELAWTLVRFLTEPAQMLERARVAGQLPPRRSLYATDALASAVPLPAAELGTLMDAAVGRPVTPVYTELSELLQVHLHRALSGQATVELAAATRAGDEAPHLQRALAVLTGLVQ